MSSPATSRSGTMPRSVTGLVSLEAGDHLVAIPQIELRDPNAPARQIGCHRHHLGEPLGSTFAGARTTTSGIRTTSSPDSSRRTSLIRANNSGICERTLSSNLRTRRSGRLTIGKSKSIRAGSMGSNRTAPIVHTKIASRGDQGYRRLFGHSDHQGARKLPRDAGLLDLLQPPESRRDRPDVVPDRHGRVDPHSGHDLGRRQKWAPFTSTARTRKNASLDNTLGPHQGAAAATRAHAAIASDHGGRDRTSWPREPAASCPGTHLAAPQPPRRQCPARERLRARAGDVSRAKCQHDIHLGRPHPPARPPGPSVRRATPGSGPDRVTASAIKTRRTPAIGCSRAG